MEELLTLLHTLGIPFTRFNHKAVFTCEESEGLGTPIPGAHTKQLLMKAKNKEIYVLAIVMHDKRVDTKALAKDFGCQSFSFASPEKMMELMKLTPGSVTPFGLMHDTATVNIDREGFEKFLKHTGHSFTVRTIPERAETA